MNEAMEDLRRVLLKKSYSRRLYAALAWRKRWVKAAIATAVIDTDVMRRAEVDYLTPATQCARAQLGKFIGQSAAVTTRLNHNGLRIIEAQVCVISRELTNE